MSSRGSRYHLDSAALILVIPLLAVVYLALAEPSTTEGERMARYLVLAMVFLCIALGYLLLSRYPLSITRLRRSLEDVVSGSFSSSARLGKCDSDIAVIEASLESVVTQLNRQMRRMEGELSYVEWVLDRDKPRMGNAAVPCEDQETLVATHAIRQTVGVEALTDIVGEFVDLVETCAVVYERDGTVALKVTVSDWFRYIEKALARDGTSGDWLRVKWWGWDPAWEEAARAAVETGQTTDATALDGTHIHMVPIRLKNEIIGAMGFAHGTPPRDVSGLEETARHIGADVADLLAKSESCEDRPPFVLSLAKSRIVAAARLIGEVALRRGMEYQLRAREEELRRHRDHLEDLTAERTAELEEANRRLECEVSDRRRAETIKDEFVSTVSHELRTPLAIAKEGISLLVDGIPGPVNEKQVGILQTSKNNLDRLARIINDLLDVSKIEAGKISIEKTRLDLTSVVRHVAGSAKALAQQRGLELVVDVQTDEADVFGDQGRLEQVLTNLVANAIKFTEEGTVRMVVQCRDGNVVCAVEDTGCGIAEHDMAHVFEKFSQFGRTHGAGTKGTGLGLSIAKQIVALHHGNIWVRSELGKGSCFVVELPRYCEQEVLFDRIETQLTQAAQNGDMIAIALVRLETLATVPDEERPTVIRTGVSTLLQAGWLVRRSDIMLKRGENEIVLLANVSQRDLNGLGRRWRRQIPECLHGVTGLRPAKAGYAVFPRDNETAAGLLARAEATMQDHEPTPA